MTSYEPGQLSLIFGGQQDATPFGSLFSAPTPTIGESKSEKQTTATDPIAKQQPTTLIVTRKPLPKKNKETDLQNSAKENTSKKTVSAKTEKINEETKTPQASLANESKKQKVKSQPVENRETATKKEEKQQPTTSVEKKTKQQKQQKQQEAQQKQGDEKESVEAEKPVLKEKDDTADTQQVRTVKEVKENSPEQEKKPKKKRARRAIDEDDDDDPNKPKVPEKKYRDLTPEEQKMKDERTVFVGNVDLKATQQQIKAFFTKYGAVESVRLRSVPVADMRLPRRASCILQQYHPSRESCNAYVVFQSTESVEKALGASGTIFQERHIQVDRITGDKTFDCSRTIFVGNLPFETENESLFQHFAQCGEVEGVRIVRDKETGLGKGFAYVCFKSEASVNNAFLIKDQKFQKRILRISHAVDPETAKRKAKKNAYQGKKSQPRFQRSYKDNTKRDNKGRGKPAGGKQGARNRPAFKGAVEKQRKGGRK
eukprot:TRINITY_DN1150_c0_g4_i2.p1 TRINITY_DN1150_c0_g4~~TRINITY_DN1150_c0_g4_i2.p1  ORF type:complete len:485 (-),score=132.62 TRINITY_DN1150_c0_g4_i2:112-1566(-)